jgi:NAD(P)-dependent dehydrogenase (short-subunit alcohol dehydrogenase family)
VRYTIRSEEPDARKVILLIKAEGRKAIPIPGDLRQENYCQQLISKAIEELGGLDVIVSNAGRSNNVRISFSSQRKLSTQRRKTNIYAPFWTIKAAVPNLNPSSCIIATTSEQARDPAGNLYD